MLSLRQRQVSEMPSLASTSPRCELCPAKPLVYCPADQAFLCRDCDDKVHSANFIVLRHTRSALCQSCFTETGLKIQGARHRIQCFETSHSLSSDSLLGLPAMVPVLPPSEAPLCVHCSPVVAPRASIQQGAQTRMLQSMGFPHGLPGNTAVPQIRCSVGLGESCTTSAHRKPVPSQKRRRNSKQETADQEPDVVLRLASGLDSREATGPKTSAFHPLQRQQRMETGRCTQDQWLRLSVDPESVSLDSARSTPLSSGCVSGLETNYSCNSEFSSSFQQEGYMALKRAFPSSCTTPSGGPNNSTVSSVASCSFTSSLYKETAHSRAPLAGRKSSHTRALPTKQGVKRKQEDETPPKTEDNKAEDPSSAAPLGRPASSRLRRVLKSWGVGLGGINMSTQNLAYELFQRSLLKMKRGEVAANLLRLTLAACLCLATKLVELRAQVPGAKEVAVVTAVESKDLRSAEISVLKLLDWQPLKHVTDRVKAEAMSHKKDTL